ncbi:MAG: EAL domain-containing protein [Alteromonadaceae bacterium TMED7]|jgi:diguanylate cyclase (GGDEF)-like protein/PAS domain S-box-containing protein|uniref:sensor domain-containing protein n=1 Tax=uncultured Alteromonas sp. TaxID=179113 RepID=UPI000B72EF83|nr:EAL domain-containing protein [uncultured Alteromonas sp.]RPH20536.1 MAG: EAL domain-containing protein [Alteromonadaceae bacterium TMED7]|tara:strand:- start:13223 stop:14941 length:1719 start_codon:yes stop_codon:yes gene_type:complete
MCSDKRQQTDFGDSYDAAELRFLDLICSLAKVSIQGYDKHRKVIYWNESSEEIYGYSREEALGKKLEELIIPPPMQNEVLALHQQWLDKGVPIPSGQLPLQRKDGSIVQVFSSHVMLKASTDSPEMFCIDIDLSEQHAAREKLEQMASTDLLTGLPNRRHLEGSLQSRIEQAQQTGEQFGLFFLDLDMFKEVNDTLGHAWGDELLRAVSQRLQECLDGRGLITRFGGDEFVLVSEALDSAGASELAGKLTDCFQHAFELSDESVRITLSVGISLYPKDGEKAGDLLKNADLAMYDAKAKGRNRYEFFTQSLALQLQEQRKLAAQLHESLNNHEFELVYQPQFDLSSGSIAACEALLRWRPTQEVASVSPGVFIPIAERTDLILHIGRWVMEQACQQVKTWREQGINIRVDINVSGRELVESGYFASLDECRARYGLKPQDIGIELTENILIKAGSEVLEELKKQREKGVEISVDDFGVGYSSLSYLKHFPVSHLKIDRTFLKDAPESAYDGALMEAIVNVGHKLDLFIVAEGVETEEQSLYCQALNVEYAQGFLYAKPMAARELENLLMPTE